MSPGFESPCGYLACMLIHLCAMDSPNSPLWGISCSLLNTYPQMGDADFRCALWTIKQQNPYKCECVVEILLFPYKHPILGYDRHYSWTFLIRKLEHVQELVGLELLTICAIAARLLLRIIFPNFNFQDWYMFKEKMKYSPGQPICCSLPSHNLKNISATIQKWGRDVTLLTS